MGGTKYLKPVRQMGVEKALTMKSYADIARLKYFLVEVIEDQIKCGINKCGF